MSENPFARAWYVAKAICSKVEETHPDLVVALAHSGWPPVYAATVLWSETRAQPFPPLLRTNLGSEKIERFDAYLAETKGEDEPHCFVPSVYFDQIDEFWDWLAQQKDWLTELRDEVQQTLGTTIPPKRILIFDDFVYEGAAKELTMGLFGHLYPDAWTQFYVADFQWREPAIREWFDLYHSDLIPALQALHQSPSSPIPYRLGDLLKKVVVGTTDVSPNSLAYCPITAESQVLVPLLPLMAAEEWLTLPKWFYAQIRNYILQCHRERITPPSPEPEESSFLKFECGTRQ